MPTKLRSMIQWLRRHYPTRTPVTVRIAKSLPGMHGVCEQSNGRCIIRIERATQTVMEDVLLEEWSHCLRWDCPIKSEDDDHDAIFWAILGQITKKWRDT